MTKVLQNARLTKGLTEGNWMNMSEHENDVRNNNTTLDNVWYWRNIRQHYRNQESLKVFNTKSRFI